MVKQGERWIIFYTDGSTFSSADGTPWDAPRRDIQSIANCKANGEGWYNVNQWDYVYYEQDFGGWNEAADLVTIWEHMMRAKHPLVLFGRMLCDDDWKKTHRAIMDYCRQHARWINGHEDERPPQTYL